ncbi:MAG: SMC family ATPase [Anaerostipes sp.]|nr:SMC family ATPase [Anaerostipes sp.]
MRPLMLEFCGLGPFPTENKIDFEKLAKEGLFLISGPTGSGKTTIFDAISYSLFGEVSGEERSKENLRSDFAVPEKKTYITLFFSHRGKEYMVERTPRYERPKMRGEGMTVTKEEATLHLPNGDVVTGFSQVNQEIQGILGIDYDQFKRLSMLAQGEFQQLLVAKSSERVEIFRSIFQTQIYQKIQKTAREKGRQLYLSLKELVTTMEETANISVSSQEYMDAREHGDFHKIIEILEMNEETLAKENKIINDNIVGMRQSQMEQINYLQTLKNAKDVHEKLLLEENKLEEKNVKLKSAYLLDQKKQQELKDLEEKREEMYEQRLRFEELRKLVFQYKKLENEIKGREEDQLQQQIRIQAAQLRKWKEEEKQRIQQKKQTERKKEEYQRKEMVWKQEKNLWMKIQSEFFAANIGMIADSLEEGKPCPVCGSIEHPNKAKSEKSTVTKEDVKIQEDKSLKAEQQYQECYHQLLEWMQRDQMLEEQMDEKPEVTLISTEEAALYETKSIPEETEHLQKIENELQAMGGKLDALKEQLKDIPDINQMEQQYQELVAFVEKFDREQKENQKALKEHEIQLSNVEVQMKEVKKKKSETQINEISQEEIHQKEIQIDLGKEEISVLEAKKEQNQIELHEVKTALSSLKEKETRKEELEKKYGIVGDVEKLLNGDNGLRLTFEQYVLITYFNDILKAANTRLLKMTNGRYEMYRQENILDGRRKDNLEIEVLDYYTGKKRPVKTLSGGESFKAALCLALGLSDIVQNNVGGIEIDVLFVDEGFGSLDQESLDQAVEVLMELADGKRLIGIISHVTELKSRIDQQIQINKKNKGSKVEEL